MNRYQIARGEVPPYGYNTRFGEVLIGEPLKGNHFNPSPNSIHFVSILSESNKTMFDGAEVHYWKKYFLCKKGLCCEKLGHSKHRTACVLLIYCYDPERLYGLKTYQILPWMFPLRIYKNLKSFHKLYPLDSCDLVIERTGHSMFNDFKIRALEKSLWKESEKADEIHQASFPIIKNLKKRIARDLSLHKIAQLFGRC